MINLTGYGLVGRTTNSAGAASLIAFNGSTTQYLNGAGSFSTPAGGGSGTVTSVTAGNGIATISNGTTTPTVNLATPASVTGTSTNSAGTANTGHTHAVSGLTVAVGGTGATTFTSGNALIGAGTGAITTRAIVTSVGSSTTSTSLVTEGAVRTALNSMGGGGAYIPLAGTASGSPVTGKVEFKPAASNYSEFLYVTPDNANMNGPVVLWRGTCGSGLDLYPPGTPSASRKTSIIHSGITANYGSGVSLNSSGYARMIVSPGSFDLGARDVIDGWGPRGTISVGRQGMEVDALVNNGDLALAASGKIIINATQGIELQNIVTTPININSGAGGDLLTVTTPGSYVPVARINQSGFRVSQSNPSSAQGLAMSYTGLAFYPNANYTAANNAWQIVRSGSQLLFQRHNGTSWVTIQTFG